MAEASQVFPTSPVGSQRLRWAVHPSQPLVASSVLGRGGQETFINSRFAKIKNRFRGFQFAVNEAALDLWRKWVVALAINDY